MVKNLVQIWLDQDPTILTKTDRSRRYAIKTFCKYCVGGDLKEMRACTDLYCPLWCWRKGKHEERPK